ncbi:hypothetical protein HOY34_11055 [Xinfangfangia sp. D13-10-4-6]|uniref:hypothetical protein n=1 Tax=Pseudogemmobacter hezensis TaxID=2737662 RepID=UPI0015533455|nr:hypothetical protein [Pseudogemmobacter hezensis]NPD15740.1 hypothetical protein [Pseudogemmobacter hezensis]
MDLRRNIHPDTLGVLSGPAFYPVMMVWLDWPGETLRAHSGTGPITWGGEVWQGVGKFGAVEVPEESSSGVPVDVSLSLVCDLPMLAEHADAVIRQRPGAIWMGVTSAPGGNVLIGEPFELARGTMDTLVLTTEIEGADGATAILYRLTAGLTTGPGYRTSAAVAHSHEDQSRHYPNDTAGKKLVLANARAEKTLWPAP